MKRKRFQTLALTVVVLVLMFATTSVFASGGQVRGENAQGSAVQVQVMDPPPFQP